MRTLRPLLLALAMASLPTASADAKLSATITVQAEEAGTRIVTVLSSDRPLPKRRQPRTVSVVGKGATFALTKVKGTRAPGTWQSTLLKRKRAAGAQALIGTRVRVVLVAAAGRSTLRSTVQAPSSGTPTTPGGTTAPSAPTPPAGGGSTPGPTPVTTPTPTPLFSKPAAALTGNDAYTAVQGYFTDATLTTCVAGWPACAVEERYSIATDGTFRYCRLTPTSGADITNTGAVLGIVGAEQAVDGSWAVSFQEVSNAYTHQYTWRVAADGSAAVQYWDGTTSFSGPQNTTSTGFVWVRGAKTCAY